MDFKENINESISLEFQEIGEMGGKELIFFDLDTDQTKVLVHLYEEDISKLIVFLNRLQVYKMVSP